VYQRTCPAYADSAACRGSRPTWPAVLPRRSACALTGEAGYLLRIVAPDLSALSAFMLPGSLRIPGVRSVKSDVVLPEIKRTTVVSLNHLVAD
jgi:hypothetical protein